MASILKHLRSSTADKRPTASGLADGQIAINTASGTPAMFFKDNAGNIIKVGPAHVGIIAPNASPAGSAGNSEGELWIDENLSTRGLKYYDGTTFLNLTPSGTTTTVGLVELATDAETQTGTDNVRAVTPSGLQSKISDSTSTTSSITIASSTAVKSAYDLANAALPKAGGTLTGELLISPSGSLVFEGSSDDSFETTIAVTNPTADRTITFPNVNGDVVTTGDTGTVTSTMIADGTIVNADINASAAIVDTKLATISTAGKVSNSATTATSANTASAIIARDASGNFTAGTITANLSGNASTVTTNANLTGDVTSVGNATSIAAGVIVNADVNASAAIAGTKISPDFGSQNVTTTGTVTGASLSPTSSTVPSNGVYLPAANNVAISTGGSGRLFVDSSGRVGVGAAPATIFDTTESAAGAYSSWTIRNTATNGYAQQQFLIGANGASGQAAINYAPGIFFAIGPTANDTTTPIVLRNNNGTERLRITSAGLVGIGVSSPQELFHVNNTSASNSRIRLTNATTGTGLFDGFDVSCGSTGVAALIQWEQQPFQIYTNNGSAVDPRLTIDNSGKVGIGTTSPSTTFHVSSSSGNPALIASSTFFNVLKFTSSTNTSGCSFGIDGSSNATIENSDATKGITFVGGATERARIDSSGRLGIGTQSPSSGLHLHNATAGSAANFTISNPANNWSIRTGTTENALVFVENQFGSEKARIDSSGRLGIGTSSVTNSANVDIQLDTVPATDTYAKLQLRSGNYGYILKGGLKQGVGAQLHFDINNNGAVSTQMVLDTGGRLGIGTTSPASSASNTVDVYGSASSAVNFHNATSGTGAADGGVVGQYGSDLVVFNYENGTIQFGTSNAEKARIDSSGRLLVGTSSYTAASGSGSAQYAPLIVQGYTGGSTGAGIVTIANGTAGASITNNTVIGVLSFAGNNASEFATIKTEADAGCGAGDFPGRLVFSTTADNASSPTERMRIRNDGTILINTTSTDPAAATGFQFTSGGILFDSVNASTNATNTLHVYSINAAAYRFYVGMDGTVNATNTTISAISDQRFKENIRDLDTGLNEILALQPRRFDWKKGKGKNTHNDQGFIAQEFEQVFPEMVGEWLDPAPEGEEPYKSVRADLIPVLVKAIQEQQAIINGLEVRLAALEAQ